MVVLFYVCDFVYVCCMVSSLLLGYKKRGVVITDKKQVLKEYFKTRLIIDSISILPLEVFAVAATRGEFYAAILRLNRVVRCYLPWKLCSKQQIKLILCKVTWGKVEEWPGKLCTNAATTTD